MLAIASFPRSGNHLYRYILEYVTGQFTQGIPANKRDIPIFNNIFELQPDCLSHVDRSKLLGIKCHTLGQTANAITNYQITGVHIIVRNPYNAIASHICNASRTSLQQFYFRKKNKIAGYIVSSKYTRNLVPFLPIYLEDYTKDSFIKWSQLLRSYYENWMYFDDSHLINYENLTNVSGRKNELISSLAKIKKEINQEKYNSFFADIGLHYKISSSGKDRAWGGIRSSKALTFDTKSQDAFSKSKAFIDVIESLIIDEVSYCKENLKKHPGYNQYLDLLTSYLKTE